MFGDRILKGDGAYSRHFVNHDDVFLSNPFVVELNRELVDPILSQENIGLTKKQKKAYELNMHFQDIWAVKLPWVELVLGSNGKVVQV